MIKVHPVLLFILLLLIVNGQISLYALFVASLILHEVGHVLVAKCLKASVRQITFLPIGARIELAVSVTYTARVWIALGGPAMTLLALLMTGWLPDVWQQPWQKMQYGLLLVNCLPFYPLDGGQILCNSLLTIYPKRKVYETYLSLSLCFFTIMVIVTLLMLPTAIFLASSSALLWSEVLGEWKIRKYRSAYEKNVMNRLT